MSHREPVLKTVRIAELRPTQITVGYREVAEKRRKWQKRKDRAEFLGCHLIPVLLGPKERHYIIDNHHLSRALHDERQDVIAITVVTDLSRASKGEFWTFLDNH